MNSATDDVVDKLENVADAARVEAISPGIRDRGDAIQISWPTPSNTCCSQTPERWLYYRGDKKKPGFVDEIWGRRMSSSATPTSELHGEVDFIQAT